MKDRLQLITNIKWYFLENKNHNENTSFYQQILIDITLLGVKKSIKEQFEVENRKKQIIKNCLTAFFLKSNWEDKEQEIENAIKVIEEIGE